LVEILNSDASLGQDYKTFFSPSLRTNKADHKQTSANRTIPGPSFQL